MIIHGRLGLKKPTALFLEQMISSSFYFSSFHGLKSIMEMVGPLETWSQATVKYTPLLFFLDRSLSEDETDLISSSSSSSSSISSSRYISSERHSLLQNALYPLKTKTRRTLLYNKIVSILCDLVKLEQYDLSYAL